MALWHANTDRLMSGKKVAGKNQTAALAAAKTVRLEAELAAESGLGLDYSSRLDTGG